MPIPKGTKKTEKTRQYQQAYAKENYKVAACQISKSKYDLFKAYAKSQNKTVSALLMAYIDSCIVIEDRGQENKPE